MMREIVSGLWVGDIEACQCKRPLLNGKVAGRVHACKDPCHKGRCGQPGASEPSYLSFEEPGGADLFLNMIDPPVPLFQRAMFDSFLRYARDRWVEGRPVVIHCNKGQSRAPILAMLFMAKTLKVLPDNFDEAWDGFEKLCPLAPGQGIEDWMRAHWSEIAPRPLTGGNAAAEGRTFEEYLPPDYSGATPAELSMLVQGCPIVHFSTHVTIEDKEHNFITPVPNVYQMRANEAYEICLERGIPPRLMGLKPRQVGSSTFFGHICYHHSRRFKVNGMIIGDEASRTVKLWDMFTGYKDRDTFPWDSTVSYNTERCTFTYADGSTGEWEHDTANDPKAGIGGTRQAMLYTEAARYSKTGQRTDTKVITASLASLANNAQSLAIMESTADGANGYFYRNWQGAVSLADFRAGKYGNGWVKIFAAWFEFKEHVLPHRADTEQYFAEDLDDREKKGVQLYRWTMAQIAWRRYKIAAECDNDPRIFDQDYPEDEQSCIEGSTKVGTARGIVPIRDVQVGDRLTNGTVVAKRCNGTKPLVCVETSFGFRVTCTADHLIATADGCFARADSCAGKKIKLAVPNFAGATHRRTWKQFGAVDCSLEITPTWARLIGYYMGDGCFYNQCLEVCCDRKDGDVVQDVIRCITEIFGKPQTKTGNGGNCTVVRISRSRFDDLFDGLGLVETNPKAHSKFKRKVCVPDVIWQSPRHIVREFLSALFEADGWQSKTRNNVKFFAKDAAFCADVQLLLLGFGIQSNLHRVEKVVKDRTYPGCELVLHTLAARKFAEEIGFISARKRTPPAPIKSSGRRPVDYALSDTVVSVTPSGEGEVFDLQMSDEPCFDAGGIKVHNCFLSSGRPRFNQEGMTRLELMAKGGHGLADRGVLTGEKLNVTFTPQKEDAWLWVREQPRDGSRYIAFIDPCSGEQSMGAKRPDAHAAGIIRAAEIDTSGTFRPAELVCCIDVPGGCRWDDSLIAQRTVMMANLYGGCMVVPEIGNGLGVLSKLREFGANVYQREKFDAIQPGKKHQVAGWDTNSGTRDLVVGAMADAIREQEKGFDCCYQPAVEEMQTFVVDDRGKACAKAGQHDDWVLGCGIGLCCIRFASVYRSQSSFPSLQIGSGPPIASGLS